MDKLKQEHIIRRTKDFENRIGYYDEDIAVHNGYIIPESEKYSQKVTRQKYDDLSIDKISDEEWDALHMSREEFMKNRDKYILEEIDNAHLIKREQHKTAKKDSLLTKLKRILGI